MDSACEPDVVTNHGNEIQIEGLTHCPSTSATLLASSGVKLTSVPFSACSFRSSLRVRLPAPRPSERFREGATASSAPFLPPGNETELRGVLTALGSVSLLMERSQSSVSAELRESCDMEKSTWSAEGMWRRPRYQNTGSTEQK